MLEDAELAARAFLPGCSYVLATLQANYLTYFRCLGLIVHAQKLIFGLMSALTRELNPYEEMVRQKRLIRAYEERYVACNHSVYVHDCLR